MSVLISFKQSALEEGKMRKINMQATLIKYHTAELIQTTRRAFLLVKCRIMFGNRLRVLYYHINFKSCRYFSFYRLKLLVIKDGT